MAEKSEVTKRKIIDGAAELFFRQGLFNTSQQEIADRAGVNRGLIYHYFGGTEQIAEIIFEEIDKEFYALMNELLFANEQDVIYTSIAQGRLVINYLLANDSIKRFYIDLIHHNIAEKYLEGCILRDFGMECNYLGLSISDDLQQLYSALLTSIECKLISSQADCFETMPIEDIVTIKNRIHLNILGMDKNDAERTIARAIEVSRRVHYVPSNTLYVVPDKIIIDN